MLSLAFASCSQNSEYVDLEDRMHAEETSDAAYVREMTMRLKAYNSRFSLPSSPERADNSGKNDNKKLTKLEIMKVGLADAKGALCGTIFGGWVGASLGASVASADKFVEILDEKEKDKKKKTLNLSPSVLSISSSQSFKDSIGYYHNMAEERLYDMFSRDLRSQSTYDLLLRSNSYLANASAGYRRMQHMSIFDMQALADKLSALRSVSDRPDDDFFDYLDKLKKLAPSDGEYLDYIAEYLYTCVCANVGDIRAYTLNVLRELDSSNSTMEAKARRVLTQSVMIAYSSLIYSAQMELSDR